MTALIPRDHIGEPSSDPALLGWPPSLPVEVAMRSNPIKMICAEYDISREDWDVLRATPRFIKEVQAAVEMLKTDGMTFKMKARFQSEELLKTSWKMIHSKGDEVPPSVKADLLKFTVRAAGLDGSQEKNQPFVGPTLQIQINL